MTVWGAAMKAETSCITVTVRLVKGGNTHIQTTESPAAVRQALAQLDNLIARNLIRPEDAHRVLDTQEAWQFSTSRRARDRQRRRRPTSGASWFRPDPCRVHVAWAGWYQLETGGIACTLLQRTATKKRPDTGPKSLKRLGT
jgi:hypothetical protein